MPLSLMFDCSVGNGEVCVHQHNSGHTATKDSFESVYYMENVGRLKTLNTLYECRLLVP